MLLTKAELALAKMTDTTSHRYGQGLASIAVEKEKSVITNGHYLVAVKHDESAHDSSFPALQGLEHATPTDKPILVGRDAALSALKALPSKSVPICQNAALSADGKLFVTDLTNTSAFSTHVEGSFPNWQIVASNADKKPAKAQIAVNAEYLRMLADYIERHGRDNQAVKLTITADDEPLKLEAQTKNGQKIYMLLMPMRIDMVSDQV